MATVVELVNSADTWGGLRDGYRRSQVGFPTGTVGQAPAFRGVNVDPGKEVKAPKILASAARNNAGTNVAIPYARVCPAEELSDKGRLGQGDVAFVSRYRLSTTTGVRQNAIHRNHLQNRQVTTSASHPHADVCRLAGLDWINRQLGPNHYKAGYNVLINTENVADQWRSLSLLNEWTLDGVVLSNDQPGYVMGSGTGARNDQLFNIGIQGPVQLNNGFEDDNGRGIASSMSRSASLAAGRMPMPIPDGYKRSDYIAAATIKNLIAGPFYQNYPLQMFDRKVKPLSEMFIGLVSKTYNKPDEVAALLEGAPNMLADSGWGKADVQTITVFQFVPFSSRQAYQFAVKKDAAGNEVDDMDIQDASSRSEGYAERAARRRGPLNPKRTRDGSYLPHSQGASSFDNINYLGIKEIELSNMVGAWRLGKVLDVASQRKEGYTGGPIDTAFRVTLNVDISFLDWRALRRHLGLGWIGYETGINASLNDVWETLDVATNTFAEDDGRVMQWPTEYLLYNTQPASGPEDVNIPINTEEKGGVGPDKFDMKTDADTQRTTYYEKFSVTDGIAVDPTKPQIFAPAPGLSVLSGATVAPISGPSVSSSIGYSAAAPAPAAKPKDPAPAPTAKPKDPAPAPTAKPKDPAPAPAPEPAPAPAPEPEEPPPKRAKEFPRRPALGEDLMTSIFGGSSTPSVPTPLKDTESLKDTDSLARGAQPKSFPRRNRDK